jgi:hypothetical protein
LGPPARDHEPHHDEDDAQDGRPDVSGDARDGRNHRPEEKQGHTEDNGSGDGGLPGTLLHLGKPEHPDECADHQE